MSAGTRKFILGLIGAGIVLLVLGIVIASFSHSGGNEAHKHAQALASADAHGAGGHGVAAADHGNTGHHGPKGGLMGRIWSNVLLNGVYFTGVAMLGVFFVAVSYAANAGWFAIFRNIALSFSTFFPVGAVILLVALFAGKEYLYFWTIPEIAGHDELLHKKAAYLNLNSFAIREFIVFAIWGVFFFLFRSYIQAEDKAGRYPNPYNVKLATVSAVFLVVFALSFSVFSWDWVMSVDAHWFSTMFAIRVFSTLFVTALTILAVLCIHLKNTGFLPYFNKFHQWDLGKFMFAFSVFWAYIWVCEFLLIWYANIPEEGVYFDARFQNYKGLFLFLPVINFLVPFLALMTNDSKKHNPTLITVGVVILLGHFLDMFVMIMPGTMGAHWGLGFLELGMYIMFLGLFLFVVLTGLSKLPLVAKNHQFIDESMSHAY